VVHDRERLPNGGSIEATTVFLAGGECPFSCVFCDLWRQTLATSSPEGAIPKQLEEALESISHRQRIKLYNASNFFDDGAVPRSDEVALLGLLADFEAVTVECHPSFVGERCFQFSDRLEGRFEVAMGLETVHPEALPRLNKKMTVGDFDRAARALVERGIGVRAFVLLGTPYVEAQEQVEWCLRSVEHAIAQGAEVVTIIPVRGGNGALEELQARGEWRPVQLALLEDAFDLALEAPASIVQVDVWDLHRWSECETCAPRRAARLRRMNLDGKLRPRVEGKDCDSSLRGSRS